LRKQHTSRARVAASWCVREKRKLAERQEDLGQRRPAAVSPSRILRACFFGAFLLLELFFSSSPSASSTAAAPPTPTGSPGALTFGKTERPASCASTAAAATGGGFRCGTSVLYSQNSGGRPQSAQYSTCRGARVAISEAWQQSGALSGESSSAREEASAIQRFRSITSIRTNRSKSDA
jgi:hypothetical protein